MKRVVIPVFEPQWGKEECKAVETVMAGDYLNEGKYVRQFEAEFANFVGAKHCIMVPNGALALYLACLGANIEESKAAVAIGDYYSIFAANALMMSKKMPILLDTDKNGCLQYKGKLPRYMTIPVHVNGRMSTIDSVGYQIEDCCQKINYHTPSWVSCYSFHSTKLMTCGGIGGAVCCDDKVIYEKMSAFKDHGRPERAMGLPVTDTHYFWGTNFKMSDINAAFGLAQLKRLPARLKRVKAIYRLYRESCKKSLAIKWRLEEPAWRVDCEVADPQGTINKLAAKGVKAQRFYLPTHRQRRFASDERSFPVTNHIYEYGLYLPSSPSLTDEQVILISELLQSATE